MSYSSSSPEPLWQSAIKQDPGKVLKTIYTFSTMWANEAADAVVACKYDSIIQFHKNQPKGPGFHRHPPGRVLEEGEEMMTPQKNKTSEEKEGGSEEQKLEGPKRKVIRANASTERQTSATKRGRGSMPKSSPSTKVKVQSPPPFLRSSQRLRCQWNQTPSTPPPDSGEEEKKDEEKVEEIEEEKTTPPLPLPIRSSVSSHGRTTRASRRLASARKVEDDPIGDQEINVSKASPLKDTASMDDRSSQDKMDEEDDEVDNEDGSGGSEDAVKSPEPKSPRNVPSQPHDPSPPLDKDNNYTICHGTPRPPAPSPRADISSPKEWQQQQPQHNLPQYPVSKISDPYNESVASDRVVSPGQVVGTGMNMSGTSLSTLHLQEGDASGNDGASSHGPSELHPAPPHYTQAAAEAYHQKEWGAGVLSGHVPYPSSIPGGYHPSMYGHPMHAMSYASHAGQPPIASHNYPYTMAYSWGHPSTAAAAQHPHHQGMVPPQARLGEGILPSHPGIMDGGAGEASGYSAQSQLRPPMHAAATGGGGAESSPRYKEKQKSYSDSPSTSPAPARGLMGGPAPSRPPGADMLLLGTPPFISSSPRDLPPRHQLTHGFLGSPAHQISHEHLAHHSFPYPFEPSSHPSLHMWQQSQMQGQPIRPISGIPHAHLAPHMTPHGLWYGPPDASIQSHLVPSRDMLGTGTGKKAGGGRGKLKRDGGDSHSKMATNRNNSNHNNNNQHSASHPGDNHYVIKYSSSSCFPNSEPKCPDFSITRQHQLALGGQDVCNSTKTQCSTTYQPHARDFLLGAASLQQHLASELKNESQSTVVYSSTDNW